MFRTLKTVMVAALVVLGGAQAASAAPIRIGTFALDGDVTDAGLLSITNEIDDQSEFYATFRELAIFEGVTLTLDGTSRGLDDLDPPSSPGGQSFDDALYGKTAVLSFALRGKASQRIYGGVITFREVDPVTGALGSAIAGITYDSCPDGETCSVASIFYEPTPDEIPMPEPATLLLLAGGLGTIAARRVRRSRP